MARYEHLPIYRDALALAVHLEKVVAGFSRYHKYTLGGCPKIEVVARERGFESIFFD